VSANHLPISLLDVLAVEESNRKAIKQKSISKANYIPVFRREFSGGLEYGSEYQTIA
jgi:hypothetical protein